MGDEVVGIDLVEIPMAVSHDGEHTHKYLGYGL